jgi:hypothetical protein
MTNTSVPGYAEPGFLRPGYIGASSNVTYATSALAGIGTITASSILSSYHYVGHLTVYYLDYIDQLTGKTLACTPGNFYTMLPVSNRAGLGEPPPDGRWGTPSAPAYEISFDDVTAKARAHNASLQAARKNYRQSPYHGPALTQEKEEPPPSEASIMMAAARRLNAELQAERIMG